MSGQNIDPVELAGGDSFPASDPPSWTGTHIGAPPQAPADAEGRPAAQVQPRSAARRDRASSPGGK